MIKTSSKKLSREELEALFEECREEIRSGKKCDAVDEMSKEKGWMDPVELALSTDIAHCLAGKNMEILSWEIREELKRWGISKAKREKMVDSLYGYYLIQKKEDLSLGRYIRWITEKDTEKEMEDVIITNGAFLVDIQKKDGKREWNLLCKNWYTQFIKIAFRPGTVFQQLSRDEIMVMLLSSKL